MSIFYHDKVKVLSKEDIKVNTDKNGDSYTNESIFEFLINRKKSIVPDGVESVFSLGRDCKYNIGGGSRAAVIKELGFSDNPTESECNAAVTMVNIEAYPGRRIQVHKKLVNEVQGIFWELKRAGVILNEHLGGYCFRPINNPSQPGSKTLSMHSFGCAIDINFNINPFEKGGKPQGSGDNTREGRIRTMDSPIVKAFAKYGWGWGGRYGDYMHFSKANGG